MRSQESSYFECERVTEKAYWGFGSAGNDLFLNLSAGYIINLV